MKNLSAKESKCSTCFAFRSASIVGKDNLEDKYFCDSSPSFAPSSSLFSLHLVIPDWFLLTLVPAPPDVQEDFPLVRTTRLPWVTTSGSFCLCDRRHTSSRPTGFLTPRKDACYGWLSCRTSLCARFTFCLVYAFFFFLLKSWLLGPVRIRLIVSFQV